MQYKFFTIPAGGSEPAENELNKFLSANKIVTVQKEFSPNVPAWCFLIEYIQDGNSSKTSKIDYMKVLSQEDFSVFSKLREIRKKIATEEQIPAYAVFTDEQLAQIVKTKPDSIQKLQLISGIGQSRAEKYGRQFIELLYPSENTKRDEQPGIF